MLSSPNLALPYIDVNEAQREVVHNAAIRGLDALVQLSVLDRDLASPPGSPADGQRWLVAASPTGAWSGHATHIAAWQDGAWQFYAPQTGWLVFVVDEGALIAWNGTAWVDALSLVTSLQNLTLLGVGTTADSTNPFSAKLNNALWAAKTVAEGGDGHLRYKLSKESASKTLSLLYQDNFSGRAEIGLTGDDDFHFKVSPDGTAWYESLVLSQSNGQARTLTPFAVRDAASYAAGVGGAVQLQAMNASAGAVTFACIGASATAGTAGSETGDLVVKTMKSGALTEAVRVTGAGQLITTGQNASALAVGRQGATSPALQVDSSASNSATGVKIAAAAAGSRAALVAISSGTDEGFNLDAKGSGTIRLGAISTGAIEFSRNAVPTANDGAALGTTSLSWSDAFLAAGAVVNFNNGNYTLTHSAGLLTASGKVAVSDTTDTTSATTGAVQISGGVGIAKDLYVAGRLRGGTNYSSFPNSLDLSASVGNAYIGFYPSDGTHTAQFAVLMAGVLGTRDVFFQGIPDTTAGYTYLEGWNSAGLALGTGNTTNPVLIRPNRTTTVTFGPSSSLFTTSILSSHATAGVGYATGAGGTVSQASSKSTGVTLNKVCGQITMINAALNAGVSVSFTLTNSAIAATDQVDVWIVSGATADSYHVSVTAVAAGSCRIQVRNFSGSNLSEALVLGFSVKKAVTS